MCGFFACVYSARSDSGVPLAQLGPFLEDPCQLMTAHALLSRIQNVRFEVAT